jgi:GntR family transcriptional regulator
MLTATSSLGALPTYVQISEAIARDIAAGRLLDGEKLPPERAMAADWGVAVGTLRKSLGRLVEQGLLERVQGSGNYVRHSEDAENIYAFFRLELEAGGGLPRAQMLSVDRLEKPENSPNFGGSDEAFRFRRLRFLNDTPAALEEIWLDGSVATSIEAGDISESLYHHYKSRLGLWITRAEDRVSAALVPDWSVDQFPPAPGITCGYIERVAFDQHASPIEFSRNWFDPAVATYVSRLK